MLNRIGFSYERRVKSDSTILQRSCITSVRSSSPSSYSALTYALYFQIFPTSYLAESTKAFPSLPRKTNANTTPDVNQNNPTIRASSTASPERSPFLKPPPPRSPLGRASFPLPLVSQHPPIQRRRCTITVQKALPPMPFQSSSIACLPYNGPSASTLTLVSMSMASEFCQISWSSGEKCQTK